MLKFTLLNFVPFEKNLIDECLLTTDQVDWLNMYNIQIRNNLDKLLENFTDVKNYLMEKTEPFQYAHAYEHCPTFIKYKNNSSSYSYSPFVFVVLILAQLICLLI